MNHGLLKWSGAGVIGLFVFFIGYEITTHNTNLNEGTKKPNAQIINNSGSLAKEAREQSETLSESGAPSENIVSSSIALDTTNINGNINNLIALSGSGVKDIAYLHIGGINFTPIETDGSYYIAINKNTFISGDFFIIINYKNGLVETLPQKLKVIFHDGKVSIGEFHPNSITNEKNTYITVIGNGFDKIVSVQFNNNVILKKADFKIINEQAMAILVPEKMEAGEYYLNIMTTEGVYEIPETHFTISQ